MNEKELARAAGLSRDMVRFYRDQGLFTDGDGQQTADLLRCIDRLHDAGFSVDALRAMQRDPAQIRPLAEALQHRTAESHPARGAALRRFLQSDAPPTLQALMNALAGAGDGQRRRARYQTMAGEDDAPDEAAYAALAAKRLRQRRRGRALFVALALLLTLDGALALISRGTWLPLAGHTALSVLLFFGIDWVRFLVASFNAGELLMLALTIERVTEQQGGGFYLPSLVCSAAILIFTAVAVVLSRSLQRYLYFRRNGA